MNTDSTERALLAALRIGIGWTFLYAGLTQLLSPDWSAGGFLTHTKTFHGVMSLFAAPGVLPYVDFLVKWGHTLIGLSLISGLAVRASAPFGVLLMIMYYFAHMDFPYIENNHNFLVDYHLVYALGLAYLAKVRAGEMFGLDALVRSWRGAELPSVGARGPGGPRPAA